MCSVLLQMVTFNCHLYVYIQVYVHHYYYTGVVRLVNGPTSYEGTVEVYYNGQWGTVCDDGWDLNDAQVVCRQLGFDSAIDAINARSGAYYGQGSGQIWLNNVNCVGNESTVVNCLHNGWGNNNCSHGEDAGVKCTTAFGKLTIIYIAMYM